MRLCFPVSAWDGDGRNVNVTATITLRTAEPQHAETDVKGIVIVTTKKGMRFLTSPPYGWWYAA